MTTVDYTDNTTGEATPEEIRDAFLETEGGTSLLDQLMNEPEIAETNSIMIKVKARPGWHVEFDDEMVGRDLRSAKAAATRKDDVDAVLMNALLLVDRCIGIYREDNDGKLHRVPDAKGNPITFRSLEFIDKFGEPNTKRDTVKSVTRFLKEPYVVNVGNKVTTFSGWATNADETEIPEDPTKG